MHLLGIPFDGKSSFVQGASEGPSAFRQVLHDGSSGYLSEGGLDLLQDIDLHDLGDLEIDSFESILPALTRLSIPSPTLFIGGDHSITFPIVQHLSSFHADFDILHFDAHTDLYDIYDGDPFSHACPFARIMEQGLVNQLTQVGIRTVSKHQQEQIDRFGVEVIRMNALSRLHEIRFDRPLYLSIDLDVFDPGFAPGVAHYEPGGMMPRTVIDFLQGLSAPIIGADIVELNPARDHHLMTAHLAAKLAKEVLHLMMVNR
ncbi:MAG: agmatinase [Saprospiraceae bacterium]|nr:agmatinase [Saprospiraceae bacterium]